MDVLSRHYHPLAGLNSDWAISHVQLDVQRQTLTLSLEFVGTRLVCPECGAECSMKDHAAERTWRHVDAMQFQTTLTARVPRCSCDRCGVKIISVPWAQKHSRFTVLFQAFALIDQKSFGADQDYLSVMTGIDQSRVLEVTPDRTTEAADQLWKTVSDEQRSEVKAVCMDMWQAYEASTEHRELQQAGDDRLQGVRQFLLFSSENLSEEKNEELAALRKSTRATGRAWNLKELFRFFWQETDAVGGLAFFESWHAWSIRSRLDPVMKVAWILKTRLDRSLTWIAAPISNAVAEGFNSRIQAIKSAARCFRLFAYYRIRILF